jgi:Flp pilus assembly protein TadB
MDAVVIAALAGLVTAATLWWIAGDMDRDRERTARALGLAPTQAVASGSRIADLVVRLGRIAPGDIIDALGGRPRRASGLPDVERVRAVHLARGLASLVVLGAVGVAVAAESVLPIVVVVLAPLLAAWAVDRSLAAGSADRLRVLEREVTGALDVFVLALDAGLPFERALEAYTQNVDGPLADELRSTIGDLEVGYRRREALDRAVARTGSAGLAQLSSTLRLAEDFGTPLADALRGLAADVRATRRQRLQEAALRAPVTMLLPTAAFILVPIFAIVLGPVALRVASGSFF